MAKVLSVQPTIDASAKLHETRLGAYTEVGARTILHEVAALNAEDRDTLTALLGETTLPAIIKSANVVACRNKFLLALEQEAEGAEDVSDLKMAGPADCLDQVQRPLKQIACGRSLTRFGKSCCYDPHSDSSPCDRRTG